MESKHYCYDCGMSFRSSIEQHAETYHSGGVFRGIENGGREDFLQRYNQFF